MVRLPRHYRSRAPQGGYVRYQGYIQAMLSRPTTSNGGGIGSQTASMANVLLALGGQVQQSDKRQSQVSR